MARWDQIGLGSCQACWVELVGLDLSLAYSACSAGHRKVDCWAGLGFLMDHPAVHRSCLCFHRIGVDQNVQKIGHAVVLAVRILFGLPLVLRLYSLTLLPPKGDPA